MRNLQQDARYRRTEEFIARTIAGETVLVPIRRRLGDLESIYTLNEVGTFIWERLAQPATLAQVAAAVEEAFAGDPEEIRRDMEDFLRHLLNLQAVRAIDGPSDPPDSTPPG